MQKLPQFRAQAPRGAPPTSEAQPHHFASSLHHANVVRIGVDEHASLSKDSSDLIHISGGPLIVLAPPLLRIDLLLPRPS